MEAAGLAVGTLALVGVFEDCVTLLSQIGAAKSMEKDYKLLATRLDFQRTLLLQWAERLKLYDVEEYDTRLDDPALGHLIHQGLECILQLLQDGHVLQQRYGVRPADVQEVTEFSTAVSGRLMSRLRNKSLSLRFRHEPSITRSDHIGLSHQPSSDDRKAKRPWYDSDLPQTDGTFVNKRTRRPSQTPQPDGSDRSPNDNRTCNPSSFDKIKWVIKDKEQFDSLVRKLSDLITDINKVVPPRRGDAPNHSIFEHEIQELENARELRMIMRSFAEDNSLLGRKHSKLILDRLWFRLIDDRRNHIAEAHSKTLEWACIHLPLGLFGTIWATFYDLRMTFTGYTKFLYNHPEAMSSLGEWAGNRKLTVASFFLWNVGSPEQSSQEGLARGLLYHVLKQNPALIPTVLPHMWQEVQSGAANLKLPSNIEMKTAFEKLGTETTTGAFAFFIDGLDEFTGNYREGISFVKSLATNPNIKLLVSSRPIDTCVAAFSSAPKLRLQDLTKPDIERYINDVVRSHPYVAEHDYLSNMALEGLVNDLRSKADGIFLWVVLACRTLIEGFEAYDDAEELRRRVDELPPELESLFRHILNSLPPRFLRQAAKLLRICYVDRCIRPNGGLSAIPLAWAHENDMQIDALEEDFVACSDDEIGRKFTMLEGRLRSRCRGLIEAHTVYDDDDDDAPLPYGTVGFMHRTVFEFLSTSDVWQMDCLRIDDDQFDATTVLAYMAFYELCFQYSYSLAEAALWHVSRVERDSPKNLSRTVNRLAFVLPYSRGDESTFYSPFQHMVSLDDRSLLLALEFDLATFVQDYDVRGFNTRQKLCNNLFQHVLEKPIMYEKVGIDTHLPISAAIVGHLIRSGCDPTESIALSEQDTTTPWEIWMESEQTNVKESGDLENAEITMMMIRAGTLVARQSPSAHVAHVYTKDYRAHLIDQSGEWLKGLDRLKNLQDQERMKGLCNEIMEAVAASYESDFD